MNTIYRIYLASSYELKAEREAFAQIQHYKNTAF